MNADYAFRTRWRVEGEREEVARVLADGRELMRWWPSVYLDVEVLREGDPETGLGASGRLHTRGLLPYTLTWVLTITSPVTVDGYTLTARGDLEGEGTWTFRQDGPDVEITYDWRVRAGKPLLRRLTWLLRPVFTANHHWAMARGLESLRLELRRRAAVTEAERAAIPPPPGVVRWPGRARRLAG